MENINSFLFLDYILNSGFNPYNYQNILELFSKESESMVRNFINTNHFILSRDVDYDELDRLGLNGAIGYLNFDGIRLPKIKESEDYFLGKLGKDSYPTFNVNDFDVIIGNGIASDLIHAFNYNKDHYLGMCVDKDDEDLDTILSLYRDVVSYLNLHSDDRYMLAKDTDSEYGKELIMISEEPIKILKLDFTPNNRSHVR